MFRLPRGTPSRPWGILWQGLVASTSRWVLFSDVAFVSRHGKYPGRPGQAVVCLSGMLPDQPTRTSTAPLIRDSWPWPFGHDELSQTPNIPAVLSPYALRPERAFVQTR